MNGPISPDSIAVALRRYLAGESGAEELRAYLAACDAAIQAGEAEGRLSGPVGTAALAMIEQEEGVRPAADVRSTLAAVVRSLIYGQPPAKPERRGRLPRPPRPAASPAATQERSPRPKGASTRPSGPPPRRRGKRQP